MGSPVRFAITAIWIGLSLVRAQTLGQSTTNATCVAQTAWMQNSLGQNPCLVSSYLSGVCNGGTWFVPTLVAQGPYNPPQGDGPGGATDCRCNTVVYNLLQACSVCQGGIIGSWGDWIGFCNASNVHTGYPEQVPGGTIIPAWAQLDPTVTGSWNATQAQSYAASGQNGGANGQGQGGGGGNENGNSGQSSKSHSSNTGAIVGGVVGGIAGLLLLAAAIFFFIRWRRNRMERGEKVTPTPYHAGGGAGGGIDPGYNNQGYIEKHHPSRTDLGTPAPMLSHGSGGGVMPMKQYDPSDPSTFPTTPEPTSWSHGQQQTTNSSGFSSPHQHPIPIGSPAPLLQHQFGPPRATTGVYTGAAEV